MRTIVSCWAEPAMSQQIWPLPDGVDRGKSASPIADDGSGGTATERTRPARSSVEEQRRLRRTSRAPLRPEWSRGRFPDIDKLSDIPDEWGMQSFPASDPPQNW